MEVWFIRHAQPDWFAGGHGVDKPDLTALGEVQAKSLAAGLAGQRFDALWVSPLKRAIQTAAPVAAALDLQPTVLPFLAEVGSPPMSGKTKDEVGAYFRSVRGRSVAAWWAGLPGAEPLSDFVSRIGGGLDGALTELGAQRTEEDGIWLWTGLPQMRVLVVCHAGTSGAGVSHLLGLPQAPWPWKRFLLRHTGIARLTTSRVASGAIFSLAAFNELGHIPEAQRTH
jgi:broad specificity phosphatase PhoE